MKLTNRTKTIDATDLLMDSDMEKILLGTYGKSRSAQELSEMYGIQTALCHRKVRILMNRGLLSVTETVQGADGKETKCYTANLENAYVYYDSGRMKVRFTVVLQMAEDFRRRYERSVSRIVDDINGEFQT